MNSFFGLLIARTKEFYRDRSALGWSLIFPLLLIVGCAIAFSSSSQTVVKINQIGDIPAIPFSQLTYVDVVQTDNLEQAKKRVQHHQTDLLLYGSDPLQYWINEESSKGLVAEQLLLANSNIPLQKNTLSGQAVRYVDWVVPGILGMNMMFAALFGVGYVIVRYRKNGVLKRLQATPVNAFQFIAAQLTSRLIIIVFFASVVFVGCYYTLDLLVLGSFANLLLVAAAGGLNLIAFGLIISARTSSEEFANGILNLSSWPMMFLSEVWFSLEGAPLWLQQAANWLPLTHIVKPARAIMIDGAGFADIYPDILWLLITGLLFMLIAAKMFRWHSSH